MSVYGAEQIQVLEGLEAVRKRPGMYIGSTDTRGLHHLVWEVVDNSVDEAMAGHCDYIEVILERDNSVTVVDNGRGIPVAEQSKMKKSALEVVMTVLHAGGKFGGEGYKVAGGLHGVGVSVVNALSERVHVEVCRDGGLFRQDYRRGVPTAPVMRLADSKRTSTRTRWLADAEIFGKVNYSYDTIAQRLRETCYLTPGLRIRLIDKRRGKESSFYFEGGIKSFVKHLNRGKAVINDRPFFLSTVAGEVQVEVAIQYTGGFDENVKSYANNIATVDGGSHITGFRVALTRAINEYARSSKMLKEKESNFSGDDVREGLTAVVSVRLPNAQFEGQTKGKLGNSDIAGVVSSALQPALTAYFRENPQIVRKIIEKCLIVTRAREASRNVKELVTRKSSLEVSTLPGKLADCSEKNPAKCELYLVEGDSAGGSAKQGRDRRFQAILPLRGKILNVEKAKLDRLLNNEEIRSIVTAIGAGVGKNFDFNKLRYNRIVIMTDADQDGGHIRTLLLTFFFRYLEPLVLGGHLYIAQPPLYKLKYGKESFWAYDEDTKAKIESLHPTRQPEIQRYKGLGEMNPEQLWETTMNPENRTLLRVDTDDLLSADHTFDMIMGREIPPRYRFIQSHATDVINLDV